MNRLFNCYFSRRFGVEIELNTFDGVIRKFDKDHQIPYGADVISVLIRDVIKDFVEIRTWEHNYNNNVWIVKPDSSCGIEVCTPVLKGWLGLKNLVGVVESFRDYGLSSNNKCSFHVHVNIADLNEMQLASVIAWYIKCEHFFMALMPLNRRCNRYCQMIGMSDLFRHDEVLCPSKLIERVSSVKYFSLNAYHFVKGGGFGSNMRKKTLEFRIGDNKMCLDGIAVKCWIRLLLHFVNITKDLGFPSNYSSKNVKGGLTWLDPSDVFKLLKFDQKITNGLDQVKNWILERAVQYSSIENYEELGFWSYESQHVINNDFREAFRNFGFKSLYNQNREEILYSKKYII